MAMPSAGRNSQVVATEKRYIRTLATAVLRSPTPAPTLVYSILTALYNHPLKVKLKQGHGSCGSLSFAR